MKHLSTNNEVPYDRREIYDETAELTFEVLKPFLSDPDKQRNQVIEILKTDYKLIHLLTKRHHMK